VTCAIRVRSNVSYKNSQSEIGEDSWRSDDRSNRILGVGAYCKYVSARWEVSTIIIHIGTERPGGSALTVGRCRHGTSTAGI
jgi:hypothetical protein